VLSVFCCLVVMYLGGGMAFEVMYVYVGSACSDGAYFITVCMCDLS